MGRVGAPMAVADTLVWQTMGDQVARQAPPTDPTSAFHVLFKLMKRILFQNIVQPLHSSLNRFPFEAACCSVALLSARLFLPDTRAASMMRFCRVHHHHQHQQLDGTGAGTGVPVTQQQQHTACATPTFPTPIMATLFACNHILLSHLVGGDAITVVMEQVLRTAICQSCDFFVVVSLVVVDMQARARHYPATGYALEPVHVTFQNYILSDGAGSVTEVEEEVEHVAPCRWQVTFPARKTFAAFVANRQLWLELDHVPVFNAVEVGQTLAADMKRRPAQHTASPLLLRLVSRHSSTNRGSARGRAARTRG